MNMRRRALLFPVLLMAFAAEASAAELWKAKPVGEWTGEETQRFLRDSPWVRKVAVGSMVDLRPAMGSVETGEGRRESSGAEQAPSTETIEVERGRGQPVYFVEWSSAKIVRQANSRLQALLRQGMNQKEEPPALPVYVLTVSGANLKAFETVTDAEAKSGASLRLKGSNAILEAVDGRVRKAEGGRVVAVQFAFPRALNGRPTIPDQENSAEFTCKAHDLALKATFNLKKMSTGQGRDL